MLLSKEIAFYINVFRFLFFFFFNALSMKGFFKGNEGISSGFFFFNF